MQAFAVSYEPVPSHIPWEVLIPKEDRGPRKLSGFGASPGVVEGPCTVIRDPEALSALHDGAILVCERQSPNLMQYMGHLRGWVAGQGGSLSIPSAYARELEIPAVVCVGGSIGAIHTGDILRIDGSMGIVEITGRVSG